MLCGQRKFQKVVLEELTIMTNLIKQNKWSALMKDKCENAEEQEAPHNDLTEREVEVLKQIALEKSSSEIAEHLKVSIKTVETYRRNLYKKLKVKNVVGLAMYAVKNNIV